MYNTEQYIHYVFIDVPKPDRSIIYLKYDVCVQSSCVLLRKLKKVVGTKM